MNLFAYGTLMCQEIFDRVAGCHRPPRAALLHDFQRLPVLGEVYPGLVRQAGERVVGVVYANLPPWAGPRLDLFEGEMYCRQTVVVRVGEREEVTAETYVARGEFAARLGAGSWSYEEFARSRKSCVAAACRGF